VAAEISERAFADLRAPVARVTLPDAPAPSAAAEERAYYPDAETIAAAARQTLCSGFPARRAGNHTSAEGRMYAERAGIS
jgi:hypothetical protein